MPTKGSHVLRWTIYMENTLLRECHERFRTETEQQEITQGLGCAPPPPATPQSVHLFPLRDLLGACKGRASRGEHQGELGAWMSSGRGQGQGSGGSVHMQGLC